MERMKYFDDYVSNYDMSDNDINYKYYHSYRVMDVILLLSKKMNLSKKDTELAKVIGLLHDIGRFEQDKLYNNFIDGDFDHGNFGEKILRETNILEKTSIAKEDYNIVYKAVKNHNKYQIESGLNDRELFFAKLVRDADKLDIFYVLGNETFKKQLIQDDNNITNNVSDFFYKHVPVDLKCKKNANDHLIAVFSFMYDINFPESLYLINRNNYLEKIFNRIECHDIFLPYYMHIKTYLLERLRKNEEDFNSNN